ncbi:MAG: YncE family protein [Candidatus Kryptonium sp.]|nr:YncE family protein [Candidatus Kryptonium sp.]MCX7762486.1 YncE family protein [Candidatus Kryptonium sp.]MDW8109554.1 YncE family protein [Candidatus Kryptonium sp.]
MKKIKIIFALFLTVLLIYSGCKKSEPVTSDVPVLRGVYVLNEGNFGRNNSTLSYYVPDSNIVYEDVFSRVNGRGLGDTGNDIVISGDGSKAYIVVNNSDKIEVIETRTHRSLATILLSQASPYKIALHGNRGYVTNLYRGAVSVIDLTTNRVVVDTIKVGSNPTGIVAFGNKVYVANSGFGNGRTVSVIDPSTNRVIKTINVGDGPDAFAVDQLGRLWVLCYGSYGDWQNPNDDTDGKLFAINVSADVVVDSIVIGGHPSRLLIVGDFAYTIKNGNIVRINLRTKEKNETFIRGNFYSIGFDPLNRHLYCSDAKDFVQKGEVYIYDLNGAFIKKFQAGIIPSSFAFAY